MPLAGAFAETYDGPEHERFPLRLMWCVSCRLMQTGESVSPDRIFRDYSYRSSVAQSLVTHFDNLAGYINTFIHHDLVVDIGCNDGVLIRPLIQRGIRAIGIDPSDIARDASNVEGWPLVNDYLTKQVAEEVVEKYGHASVVVASNVFAHTQDVHALCEGVRALLTDHGVFICEVHYLGDLLKGCQFDTVYHEHELYYSIHALRTLFEMHDLHVYKVDPIDTHAGSIRVFATRSLSYRRPFEEELPDVREFATRAKSSRDKINFIVTSIARHRSVWAYGAAGRCTIMLNWCGLNVVSRVVDASPRRVGRLVPGIRTPIVSTSEVDRGICGAMLVTAWNYFDEIRAQHSNRHMWWIKPLPTLTIS